SGTYTLEVYGYGDATGDYSFRLLDVADQAVVALRQLVTNGVLGYGTPLYRFEGTNGQRLFFDAMTGGVSGYWNLYGPTDASINRSEERRVGKERRGRGGRYALKVTSYNPNAQTNAVQEEAYAKPTDSLELV